MAITVTHKTDGADEDLGVSATTASVAFVNNRLYTVCVAIYLDIVDVTSITGGGITWVRVNGQSTGDGAGDTLFMYRGLVTSGATTGALTINMASGPNCVMWSVDEWLGMDTSGTNGSGAIVQSNVQTGFGTVATSTLSAFGDATNVALACFCKPSGGAFTPDGSNGGYAELVDRTNPFDSSLRFQAEWNTGSDTQVTASYTGSNDYTAVGAEIKNVVTIPPATPAVQTIITGVQAGGH